MLRSLDSPLDCRRTVRHAFHRTLPLKSKLGLISLAVGALCAGAARADTIDALHAFADVGYSHDNNLFRLPDASPGYDDTRGDNMRTVDAGLSFNQTYGRQVLTAQAKVTRVNFDHFTALNYNGKDMQADWGWHLGNHLEGNLGGTYSEVLAPYTDIVTNQRNLRTQKGAYGKGAWTFHPSWRLRGSVEQNRYKYDLDIQAPNNHKDNVGELGLDYLASSSSSVGLQMDKTQRRYDILRVVDGQQTNANSDQTDLRLRVVWRVTPVTELQFLGGHSRRTYDPLYSTHDSSGGTARLSGNTLVDGKLRVSGSVYHEFASVESSLFSYSTNTGANAALGLDLSAKLQLQAQSSYLKRSFNGLLAASLPFDFSDRTRTNNLTLTYAPLSKLQLSASLFRERRSGFALLGSGSYHDNGASLNLNLQY